MAQMVQGPVAYRALLAVTFACGLAGVLSMPALSARLRAAPAIIAVDKAALAQALEASPWFSLTDDSTQSPSQGDAPVLWLLTGLHCPRCEPVEAIAKTLDLDVRVVATTPRGADPTLQRAVAEISRRRSFDVFRDWRARPDSPIKPQIGVTEGDVGPAAIAGYAEWSHASFDRLSKVAKANDVHLAPPALFWRRGREWRLAVQPDEEALRAARRDLAAGG